MAEITFAALLPLFYFMFVGAITPGPNNIMLAASGMNFGYKKTIPHILGIVSGCALLMFACMIGLGAIFDLYPPLKTILMIGGSAYLVYLAYRIATAGKLEIKNKETKPRPLNFCEAFAFQFINPKAWVITLAAISTFLPAGLSLWFQGGLVIFMALTIGIPAISLWVICGKAMALLFTSDKHRRIVNFTLAGLLIATIPMMLL